ncbi:MAG: hypothetical protein K2N77_11565 [Lachnospiraceae bacterium]|nr:hypothetical protein [Lachnospiraceae bacterium]
MSGYGYAVKGKTGIFVYMGIIVELQATLLLSLPISENAALRFQKRR